MTQPVPAEQMSVIQEEVKTHIQELTRILLQKQRLPLIKTLAPLPAIPAHRLLLTQPTVPHLLPAQVLVIHIR